MAEPEDKDDLLFTEDEEPSINLNRDFLSTISLLNTNMLAVNESLKQFSTQMQTAEPARKRPLLSDKEGLDDQQNGHQSDADQLLNQQANKRQKVVNNDGEMGATQAVVNNDNNNNGGDVTESPDQRDDPLLEEIAQAMNDAEKSAPKIAEQLAKIINSRWLNKLSDESLREKLDTHLRPVNCDRLIIPKVNPEIWGRLDKETRSKDLKLSYLQTNLAAVGNIVSQATDMLLTARAENSEVDIENLIRKNMDAIAIMGHISYDLAQRRRDVIRPTLNKEYATLCASHVPVTTLLFGDELQTQLNHIRASNKIKNTASGSQYYPPRRHFSPQQAPARSGQRKPFFLETAA